MIMQTKRGNAQVRSFQTAQGLNQSHVKQSKFEENTKWVY